ncbi:hypothetical protein AEAC466_04260 [Asticcacaulis sp. AC466]|uniref:phage pre-tape measure protein n=1 Tax=Asticcacaulis sp. AC466 TaxID=1282362 RepID=UPI0003C40C0F|nr:hypothetical protein [Asticcacaulis sp. AC466]ESQ85387.1 hypothetical protein AEAC466_04260 [Asticcacaulis sp. AC466]
MSLKAIALQTQGRVEIKGVDPITVYGLSPSDIIGLIDRNRASADKMFADVSGDKTNVLLTNPSAMAGKLFKDAPTLVADAIAVATRNPTEIEEARDLPVGLQIKLIEEILRVTAFVEGGLGELLEIVIGAMREGTSVVKQLKSVPRFQDGSPESEGK